MKLEGRGLSWPAAPRQKITTVCLQGQGAGMRSLKFHHYVLPPGLFFKLQPFSLRCMSRNIGGTLPCVFLSRQSNRNCEMEKDLLMATFISWTTTKTKINFFHFKMLIIAPHWRGVELKYSLYTYTRQRKPSPGLAGGILQTQEDMCPSLSLGGQPGSLQAHFSVSGNAQSVVNEACRALLQSLQFSSYLSEHQSLSLKTYLSRGRLGFWNNWRTLIPCKSATSNLHSANLSHVT